MNDPADIIGVLGFALAVLSLGWQVVTWVMSAGRARCFLIRADGIDEAAVERVIGKRAKGHTSFIGIEVHNVGRAPLVVRHHGYRVKAWKRLFKRRDHGRMGSDALGPRLPHTIPPGDAARWWTPTAHVRHHVPEDSLIQVWIITAHAREVRARSSYALPPR